MHDFQYQGDDLYCEEVPIQKIADELGTPFYCYSHHTLKRHFEVFDQAFQEVDRLICFSVKSCSNLAVLKLFTNLGGGMDIVSGGELFRVLKAGVDPQKIVYAGVGKTAEEVRSALEANVLMFNVESPGELVLIDEMAKELNTVASIALRVNPDVDPETHPYISTGLRESKFGFNVQDAMGEFKLAKTLDHLKILGVHAHIGSQITQTAPFMESLQKLIPLLAKLRDEGIEIRYLDVGGGLGIMYENETPPLPSDLAKEIVPLLKESKCTIIFEPGRVIVGNAGVMVTKVLYTKKNEAKNFVVVDAAMNDLIRPALYGSFQNILPVHKEGNREEIVVDIVGPICESGDFFAKERVMTQPEKGDLITVMSAGAYGFTMASNYNSRCKVPEVLVAGSEYSVIRRRETYEDLIRGEEIPDFLQK